MSPRPTGLLAMSHQARDAALPPALLARLRRFVTLDTDTPVTDFAAADPEALARTDILITGWGCPPVDAAALAALPRLRLVAHAAGTVKHHLTEAVWRRGVVVSSAAAANAEPVAEYTRAVVVLALKRAFRYAAGYRAAGDWPGDEARADAGARGRVVGVIGASRIGRRVLELLAGDGHRLLLADPYCDPATAAGLGAELVGLDELCRRSEVVSIHAPQLPATRHLLDDRRLGLLPDGAVLVNTARGSLVDTDALVRHCSTGRIDAILDVTEPEPLPADHPLLELSNVMVTPHLAGAQGTEVALLGEYAVAEVARFCAGEPLLGEVLAADLDRIA